MDITMKIYDISQEVFGSKVFPGDPAPGMQAVMRIAEGGKCNLSAFSMCAHNGTHVDAPFHFYENGKTIEKTDLERYIGIAYVAAHEGVVTANDAISILEKARETDRRSRKRILIKGKAVVSLEAAKVFAEAGILLLGNESQTVGPEEGSREVHLQLLGAEVTLLEGIRSIWAVWTARPAGPYWWNLVNCLRRRKENAGEQERLGIWEDRLR